MSLNTNIRIYLVCFAIVFQHTHSIWIIYISWSLHSIPSLLPNIQHIPFHYCSQLYCVSILRILCSIVWPLKTLNVIVLQKIFFPFSTHFFSSFPSVCLSKLSTYVKKCSFFIHIFKAELNPHLVKMKDEII